MADLRLDLVTHDLECPYCQKKTRRFWPGDTIMFASAKCAHCGMEFDIVQNKPWLGGNGSSEQQP